MRFLLKLGALLLALAPAAFAQNGAYGPSSGGSAIIDFAGVPSGVCSGDQQAKNLANGHLFQCFGGSWLEIGPGAAGSAAFASLTGGTSSQAYVIGAGGSLGTSGGGTIAATSMAASGLTGLLLAAQFPALTGDGTTTAGSLAFTLGTSGVTAGSCGDTTHSCSVTADAKGRITALANNIIAGGGGGVSTFIGRSGAVVAVSGDYSFSLLSGILLAAQSPAYTGDVTSPAGSLALTIAATGSTAASCGDATHTCAITFNTKGQATSNSNVTITGGGSGIGSGTAHGLAVYNSSSTITSLTPATTNGLCTLVENVTAGVAVDPTCLLSGIPVVTPSTPYNQLYSDRGTLQRITGGSTFAFNLMQIAGNGASNFPMVLWNGNSGPVTMAANSADKVNNGSLGGTFTIPSKSLTFLYQDSSSAPGNWWPYNVLTDLSAIPIANVGTAGLSATLPTTISTAGVIATPAFVASGGSHAAGIVPDPGSSAGTTKFLREDATFAVPAGGGSGLTSVGLTMPLWLAVANSPLTANGTLAVTAQTAQTSHQVIGTCGTATTFTPCALVAGDIPVAIPIANIGSAGLSATAPTTISSAGVIATPAFVASGGSHAAGLVPDPGSSAGTTKFLREDATFAVPAGAGGLTSVGLTMPPAFGPVANTPLTANGTLAATYLNPNTNQTFDTNVPFIQLLNTRRSSSLIANGSTGAPAFTSNGDIATNTGSAATVAPTASAPAQMSMSTTSTINTNAGTATQTIHRTGRAHGMLMQAGAQLNTVANSARFFLGISDQTRATMTGSNVPAGNFAGFEFDNLTGTYTSLTNTTQYVCIQKDNTTEKATTSGISGDASFHYFAIFEDIPNSSYHYYIDNVEVCGTGTTANIPTTGTNMAGMVTAQNLAATTTLVEAGWIQIVEDK